MDNSEFVYIFLSKLTLHLSTGLIDIDEIIASFDELGINIEKEEALRLLKR